MQRFFYRFSILFLLIALGSPVLNAQDNRLQVYPAPQGALLNDSFQIQVRKPGGQWLGIPSYLIQVAKSENFRRAAENASMAFFDFAGTVEVKIRSTKEPVSSVKIRPLSYNIEPETTNDEIRFTLNDPRNLSVEINNNIFNNLHLFANPMQTSIPDKSDKNVIYFGPGIHDFKGGEFAVPSGKTVYVDGSAILRGKLLIHDVKDVKIMGRGMVEYTVEGGIHIENSKNVLIEGLFTTQCATGGSQDVTIRNVKSISYYQWGDGMNVFASSNVLFDRVFCRNSDDCTTVYATRLGHEGSARNITMQNSTLWADVAHPIFLGIHGNAENPDTIENVTYKNIDILDHKESQLNYQGAMAINAGDNNIIRNIRFEDIRVEDFREGQLLNLRIFYNPKYCAAPGQVIEDIYFKNIQYTGENAELSIISGYNSERMVRNVTFENLSINGKLIYDNMPEKPGYYLTSDMARIYIGEFAENVKFLKTAN